MSNTVIVHKGQTLGEIAREHHTSVAELVRLNHLKNANLIVAGQQLTLPSTARARPQRSSRPSSSSPPPHGGAQAPTPKPKPAPSHSAPPPSSGQTHPAGAFVKNGRSFPQSNGYPVYAQGHNMATNDREPWADLPIGPQTVSQIGCAMTSVTMALSGIAGQAITPDEMNRFMNQIGGFSKTGAIQAWPRMGELVTPKVLLTRRSDVSANTIDKELEAGRPVVVQVDYTKKQGKKKVGGYDGVGDHWILITGRSGGTYSANDPAGGRIITMHRMLDGRLEGDEANGHGTKYRTTGNGTTFNRGAGSGSTAVSNVPSTSPKPTPKPTSHTPPTTTSQSSAPHGLPPPSAGEFDWVKLRKWIELNEGRKTTRYLDSKGHPTIGVGFNLDRNGARQRLATLGLSYDAVKAGTVSLTDAQIDELFKMDMVGAVADVREILGDHVYDRLNEARKIVVIDLVFNLGSAGFAAFKKTIEAIQNGKFETAADELKSSLWYTQVGNRAKRDVAAMRSGTVSIPGSSSSASTSSSSSNKGSARKSPPTHQTPAPTPPRAPAPSSGSGAAHSYAEISRNFRTPIPGSRHFTWHDALWLPSDHRYANEAEVTPKILETIVKQAAALDQVRDHFNQPIVVHCWLRPPAYNAKIGGARNSAHLRGGATDFHIEGLRANEVRQVLIARKSLYPGAGELGVSWVHLDLEHTAWFHP